MKYTRISREDAYRYYRNAKGDTVLIATQDLLKDDVGKFVRKKKGECEDMIKTASVITYENDDFIKRLWLSNSKKTSTILLENR